MGKKEIIIKSFAIIGVILLLRMVAIKAMDAVWSKFGNPRAVVNSKLYEIADDGEEQHKDMCIDGVTYMKFYDSGAITVKFTKRGLVERCER